MRHLSTAACLAFALMASLLATAPAVAAPYAITGVASNGLPGNLLRTEYTVQAGPAALDRFKMVRIARNAGPLRGALLWLPPLGTTFSIYEQRDESGAPGTSLAEFFALRGYDVWGYSPRYEGITAGSCEAGVVDCSAMAGWDLQSMVEDITFVRSQIEALRPGVRVVAAGTSLGGMLALAVANAHPADYAGIVPWEGMLATDDPAVEALNLPYCFGLTAQLGAGTYFEGVANTLLKHVTSHARTAPAGLTPIPLFPPFLTNHQVLIAFMVTPAPSPVSQPVPGYLLVNGSVPEDRFFFASEERLAENVTRFNSYIPLAAVKNVSCGLAGLESQHVANLANFHGAVLGIGGGRGFGAYMQPNLDLIGASSSELLLTADFGHIDHFMTPRHRDYVERPILDWLRHVVDL